MARILTTEVNRQAERDYRVLVVSYDGIQTAFHSQTAPLAGALRSVGCPVGFFLYLRLSEWDSGRRELRRVCRSLHLDGPVWAQMRPPYVGMAGLRLSALHLRQALEQAVGNSDAPVILHCRGHFGAWLGLAVRGASDLPGLRVIADLRGLVTEEIEDIVLHSAASGSHGLSSAARQRYRLSRARLAGEIERQIWQNADGITCVSRPFLSALRQRHGAASAPLLVLPTCTDVRLPDAPTRAEMRAAARARLRLDDKFVVAYNGSLAPWQGIDLLLGAFSRVADRYGSVAHLLVLTDDPGGAERTLLQAGLREGQYTARYLQHQDVQSYLAAGDVGFLLRPSSLVNRVASPIKVAEYLAAGLPLVVSRGIGDLDWLVPHFGLGTLVDSLAQAADAVDGLVFNEAGARQALATHFSWEYNMEALLGLYAEALADRAVEGIPG